MFAYAFGLFQTIWYVILCNLFVEIFLKKRKRSIKIIYGLWTLLVILNYSVSIIMLNKLLIKQILIIVCTSIIIWAIYNQNYIKILILLLLYQAGCIVIEYVVLLGA